MPTFDYRRELTSKELLLVAGGAAGVAGAVFYLGCLMLQRTPLRRDSAVAPTQDMADRGAVARPSRGGGDPPVVWASTAGK